MAKQEVIYDDTAENTEVRVTPLVPATRRDLLSAILVGAGVGLVVALMYFLLNKYVFGAVLCRAQSPTECTQAPTYSMLVAVILASIGGVAGLARARVYRPLLVAIAAAIALWGLNAVAGNVVWYFGLLASVVLFALAYGVFAWVARIRNFILSVVVTVVLMVLVRWVLVA
jgi:hypothetical protein